MYINYRETHFFMSAPDVYHLPSNIGIEIAFVGHTNAGKSSVLNTLTNQKNLARTSKRPGCTQLINFFEVVHGVYLVDLPGYGYAAVSKILKFQWQNALGDYLKMREHLKGLVVLMDIRHPMKPLDNQMLGLAMKLNIPILVLLSKADQLPFFVCQAKLDQVREAALVFMGDIQVEMFSSLKNIGIKKLYRKLDGWFTS